MAEHLLLVTAHNQVVGKLGFESHQDVYSFKYDVAWKQRDDAFPLSPQ
jgi:serine/threonine-protein kinase HipA